MRHENDVGLVRACRRDGFESVASLCHDLDVGLVAQHHGKAAPHERLIINNKYTQH